MTKKKTKADDDAVDAAELTDAGDDELVCETAHDDDDDVTAGTALHERATEPTNLHARITTAARASATHGGQEQVHALNQLELLTGRIKTLLPTTIALVADERLKADLAVLLGLL